MANNHTEATITPTGLNIPSDLAEAFKLHGAKIEEGYIYFEDGWEEIDDFVPSNDFNVTRLAALDLHELLRELLLVQVPSIESIQYEAAHWCDKLRPGEFGGSGMVVTRTHWCSMGSSHYIMKGGKIVVTSKVERFDG